ncbi:MAG: tRNA (adenosine(37)-N6)-dimethylallyltransferase MiaA [bacterium]|jgi:tRNA dimethylallyltransferase|nr:tRNA (adenosine(37)-N6)-dimethylallyltransferase MiaA [Planctomycetota bacterium]HIL51454.1 tRNA (adenosine(37)-N6)-dimethylallyltransferase MiaA [Planctomycetota bacterium]
MTEPHAFPARSGVRALVGTTAAGKSALALEVARQAGAELVSLDSMQVYRGMDIGTAKATAEERALVPHHMLDIVGPNERFDVQRFLGALAPVLEDLDRRGVRALFVGGTAFYLKALCQGLFDGPPADLELRARLEVELVDQGAAALHQRLEDVDPRSAARLHENDTRRVLRALEVHGQTGQSMSSLQREWGWHGGEASPAERYLVGLSHEHLDLDGRIRERCEAMLAAGWAAEAVAIRDGSGFSETSARALGYAEVLRWADGETKRSACRDEICLRTRQFARKQRTWYRQFDDIVWLEKQPLAERAAACLRVFAWEE